MGCSSWKALCFLVLQKRQKASSKEQPSDSPKSKQPQGPDCYLSSNQGIRAACTGTLLKLKRLLYHCKSTASTLKVGLKCCSLGMPSSLLHNLPMNSLFLQNMVMVFGMTSAGTENLSMKYSIWSVKIQFFQLLSSLASVILFLLCVSFPSAQVKFIFSSLHPLADVSLNCHHVGE